MNSFNLMPAPRRHAKACRNRLRQWAAPFLAFAVMLVMVCVTCHKTWGVGPEPLAEQIRQTKDRIDMSGRTVEDLRKQLTAARWRLDTFKGVGRQPDWSMMLKLLSDGLGAEVVLRSCELNETMISSIAPKGRKGESLNAGGGADDNNRMAFVLDVAGLARSQTAVSQFVLRMERSGMFDSVRLVSTIREPFMNSKAVAFRLKCTLEGAARSRRRIE